MCAIKRRRCIGDFKASSINSNLLNFALADKKIAYDDLNDEFGNVSVSGKCNFCLTGV